LALLAASTCHILLDFLDGSFYPPSCGLTLVRTPSLAEHTVAQAQRLQVALGRIRRASGDYLGKLLAIDPPRVRSYSKRQMRR
jgi:hypothetical protein